MKKSLTRHLPTVARVLLGLPLLVFGLNLFLNFIPQPETPMPEGAVAFAGALVNSGYMMPLIGVTQLIVGVLLLTNRFVPLALALFAPFIVNSIAFHLFLERSGLPVAAVFLALELYLAWCYRNSYRPMLAARATPA
ncbi:DoxX protein [Opitutaceae bacterium TAV1]|nr:DoxX family protein [Opitutaceae bacterium TAV5]EIQ01143.1 DoxX protein [Opitutaceae bacterium TAV1]